MTRPTSADAEIAALLRRNPQLGVKDQSRRPPIALAAAELAAVDAMALTENAGALGVDVVAPTLAAQRIELPLPPSANRYWRYTSTGVYVTSEAEDYKAGVMLRARQTNMRPYAGDVAVYVHVYRQQARGDLDNYAKVLCDSLNGCAYGDDSQVVELHMFRHDDKRNPRVEVEVRTVTA